METTLVISAIVVGTILAIGIVLLCDAVRDLRKSLAALYKEVYGKKEDNERQD